jgi:hypothetical protein
LLIKFFIELAHLATGAFSYSESDVILGLLKLVDLTLTGSLLIIVIFSGYENFVSKMDHSDHSDRPLLALSDRIAGHAEHAAESTQPPASRNQAFIRAILPELFRTG